MSSVKPIGIVVTAQDRIHPFAALTRTLIRNRCYIQVFASGSAIDALKSRGIQDVIPFKAIKRDFEMILNACAQCSLVVTGVADPFSKGIQQELQNCPQVTRLAFYDRFQPVAELPEREAKIAAKTIEFANRVLFANANLVKAPNHHPIGHSILFSQAEALIQNKEKAAQKLAALLKELGIDPRGKRIFTYCGSSGDEYCTQAFPHFLECVQKLDLSNTLFLIWSDPKAHDLDTIRLDTQPHHKHIIALPADWSDLDAVAAISNGALLTFDAAITAASLLAGYPTVQVAPSKEDAPDFGLSKRHFSVATTFEDLESFTSAPLSASREARAAMQKEWGICPDWKQRMLKALGQEPKGQKRKA